MERIALGTITNVHGVKGALTIRTDSDFRMERYHIGNRLYIGFKGDYVPVTVASHFMKGHLDVVSFEEFTSRTEVEHFKGAILYIAAADRPDITEADTYYYDDLIGLEVWLEDCIGTVKAVRETPQGHLLIIERPNAKDGLVPFRKEFVKAVTDRRITLIPWEGLL
ncbi:MAG: 16S rRNA processing protein RimM [Acholeplasmatales bacterium]|nr:MAG: 16S rRNA processing protein RimM [Acholeplasmatales bacterium]